MSAPKGRARPPARPLLYLGAADAGIFLLAEFANLLPLVPLGGPTPWILVWTSAVLVAAAGAGVVAAWLSTGEHASAPWVVIVALVNPFAIGLVAVYFALGPRIFGDFWIAFNLLAAPGLAGAALLRADQILK